MSDPPTILDPTSMHYQDPSSVNYRELQKACKFLGLPAGGKANALRNMLEEYFKDPHATLQKFAHKKTTKEGWVDWKNHAAREILLEDLEPGGWLHTLENDDKDEAKDVYEIYKNRQEEFADVPFDQFKAAYKEATKRATKRRARSAQEAEWLEHDRLLHPRQDHNQRGEPVFDMDIEAKTQLREDVNNKLHKQMKPVELWESRDVYSKYKLDIFRPRIYQEIRRKKYLNYLEKKRTKRRTAFAAKNAPENATFVRS